LNIFLSKTYNGLNLAEDFHGKTPVKWALKACNHLFTEEEIRTHTLLPSNRSSRLSLSPTRVKLLKKSMFGKFKCSPTKGEKWFKAITDSINTKGRNLKARFVAAMRKENNP